VSAVQWPYRCHHCGVIEILKERKDPIWEVHLCAACEAKNEREAAAFRHEFRPGTFRRWLLDQEDKPPNEAVALLFRLIFIVGAIVVAYHFITKYW
jgi:hypothetical protein